jgi:regulatory protein
MSVSSLKVKRGAASRGGTARCGISPHSPSRRISDPRNSALSLLAVRAHTRLELRRKLIRRGFAPDVVNSCLESLAERGWLNDSATAVALAASRSRRGQGRGRIASELAARGVSREDADAAIARLDPADEAKALRVALERRSRALPAGLTQRARSKKLFDHLVRRGFAPSAVLEALRTKGEPTDDDL